LRMDTGLGRVVQVLGGAHRGARARVLTRSSKADQVEVQLLADEAVILALTMDGVCQLG
jgi:hypothetical protein